MHPSKHTARVNTVQEEGTVGGHNRRVTQLTQRQVHTTEWKHARYPFMRSLMLEDFSQDHSQIVYLSAKIKPSDIARWAKDFVKTYGVFSASWNSGPDQDQDQDQDQIRTWIVNPVCIIFWKKETSLDTNHNLFS